MIRRDDFIHLREITSEFVHLDFAEGKACQVDQLGKVLWQTLHNLNETLPLIEQSVAAH